jgi:nucleotide-binding universal stress UspA family protein
LASVGGTSRFPKPLPLALAPVGETSRFPPTPSPGPLRGQAAARPARHDGGVAFQQIIVAYDDSEAARRALDDVADIAGDADVTVLTVVEAPLTSLGPMPTDPAELERVRQLLEDAYERLAGRGVRVQAERAVGDPADRIIDEAERRHADLVVVGSHGKSLRERLRLGSVSAKVIKDARCAVLVVR